MSADGRTNENKAAMRKIARIFSSGDLTDVDRIFSPAYVDHQRPSIIGTQGPEEFRQVVLLARRSLPNLVVTIAELIAENDTVAARLHWQSVGLTGKRVDRETIDIVRFVNRQAVEHWGATYRSTESADGGQT